MAKKQAKPDAPATTPADMPIAAPGVAQDARAERFRERILEFRRIRAGDVEPHPKNPRTHTAAQLAAVTGLLVDVGKFRPLVAFPADGLGPAGDFSRLMYADGHGRRAIDPDEVWTFAVTDLTRAEADEALFADRTGELAGYDPVLLDSLLRDVNTGCEELQQMLADLWEESQADAIADTEPADPVDAEPQTDRAAELQAKWGTAAGQLWLLGKHRLLCGDSTKPEDVARVMGGEKADCVLTDPPYGIGIAANPVRQKHAKQDWDNQPATAEQIAACVQAAPQAIIWGGNYFDLPPMQGFYVWDKEQPEEFSTGMCEMAWTNIKEPARIYRERVIGYTKEHPTQKPVGLMAWCIQRFANSETVLDFYLGSGTSLIAAENLGRRCFGLEISPVYCAVILERFKTAFPDQEIRLEG